MMKKIFAVFMALIMVALTGCSMIDETIQKFTGTAGFAELDVNKEYLKNVVSILCKDDTLILCSNVFQDKDGNVITDIPDDDIPEDLDIVNYLLKYNIKKNKLIRERCLKDCPIEEIWGMEFGDDDNIVLYSNSENKEVAYDENLNFVKQSELNYDELQNEKMAEKSKFYASEKCTLNDGISTYYGNNDTQYTFFLDNPDVLYVYKDESYTNISDYSISEKLVLNEHFSSEDIAAFSVDDYVHSKEINSASINPKNYGDYDFCSTGITGISDKYVYCIEYFHYNDKDEYDVKLFTWDYNFEPTNKDNSVKSYTFDELKAKNIDKISAIKDEYGIDIHINENYEGIEDSVSCEKAVYEPLLCEDLDIIENFLKTLPDGMIREIYSGFYDKEGERSGIRLDIVNEITYDASAFANIYTEPMELCFEEDTVTGSNLSHEFMHLFDARIFDYINQTGEFEFEWENLNKGYEHEYDINEDTHPEYNFDETCFVSEYAATNDTEDRAVVFSYIYTNIGEEKELYAHKKIKKKADLLLDMIRKSFPSVQAVDKAYWEK